MRDLRRTTRSSRGPWTVTMMSSPLLATPKATTWVPIKAVSDRDQMMGQVGDQILRLGRGAAWQRGHSQDHDQTGQRARTGIERRPTALIEYRSSGMTGPGRGRA